MKRYAACVEYDGTDFNGWQVQKHQQNTVQGKLEFALAELANQSVSVVTAGRTDSGVHATHQIVHFESNANRDLDAWLRGTNRFLPKEIRVKWVVNVSQDFHARFSAISRSYRYIIYNHHLASALHHKYTTLVRTPLNCVAMNQAAQHLVGKHDFSSFRASGCQSKTAKRCIEYVKVTKTQDKWIYVDIKANAFLQHMVRNIVGSLIDVGCLEQSTDWIKKVLEMKDRTRAGVTAPANGLYLIGVNYPEECKLPSVKQQIEFC